MSARAVVPLAWPDLVLARDLCLKGFKLALTDPFESSNDRQNLLFCHETQKSLPLCQERQEPKSDPLFLFELAPSKLSSLLAVLFQTIVLELCRDLLLSGPGSS